MAHCGSCGRAQRGVNYLTIKVQMHYAAASCSDAVLTGLGSVPRRENVSDEGGRTTIAWQLVR